jgi:hypothetical protein
MREFVLIPYFTKSHVGAQHVQITQGVVLTTFYDLKVGKALMVRIVEL